MGEWVSITIGGYDYLSWKNSFGPLLLIFSPDDLKVCQETEDDEFFEKRYFQTSVARAKKCLDCLGHTIANAKEDFERAKQSKLEYAQDVGDKEQENNLLYHFSFQEWSEAAKKYAKILSDDEYDHDTNSYKHLEVARNQATTFAEKTVLDSLPFDEDFFGLERDYIDHWSIFRILLDAFNPEDEVTLDYTYLYDGGWCDGLPQPEDFLVPKTIILTEGKFDANVISCAMHLLYPHLEKCYSFVNFSDYKIQGSTSFLTHYFKLFIASGIQNRVIALYDNDAAGLAELTELNKIALPNNFRAMHLPDLELANDYPTLGPIRNEKTNINGKACSIELYLGRDILQENGNYVPIQWKGFVDKTQTYQGEIIHKGQIQERFRQKLNVATESNTFDAEQWSEMIILLESIFSAFMD